MLIVQVYIHVKPEFVEEFRKATVENARASTRESGVARFDFIQQQDDHTRFMLTEVYRTPEAQAEHKLTAHYVLWRDTVAGWMDEPRSSTKYTNIFPDNMSW